MTHTRTRSLISVALALLVSAGCGSGFSGAKSPPTEDGLRQAIKLSTEILFKPDAKAFYKYFSKECRDTVTVGDLTFVLMFGGAFLEGIAGTKMSEFRVGDVEIRPLTASSAEARHEVVLTDGSVFANLEDSEWSGWVYEDGGWRTTDCEDFADAGDFGDLSNEDQNGDTEGNQSSGFFDDPDCSLLRNKNLVPSEFRRDGNGEIDLTCMDGENWEMAFTMSCFLGDRRYSSNNIGFAFQDEGIFRIGDVQGCLPPCSLLVNGETVPTDFDEDSRRGFSLSCEDSRGDLSYGMDFSCWESNRRYVTNGDGYAFVDDRIFRSGDFPDC